MTTSLVTGGLGFLGGHLVRELRSRGERVRVLDDASGSPLARATELADDAGIEVEVGSVLDPEALDRALRGVDRVFHLAAIVGVARLARDPVAALERNLAGAEAVVEASCREGARLLYASSSEIYGDGAGRGAFAEDDAPGFDTARVAVDGRAAYAAAKWLGERAVRAARSRGLRAVIVRPFNAVGERQSEESGAIVPAFAGAALRGEPIVVHGDGSATRSFGDAREIARAFADLLACDAADGFAVNVGGEDVRTVRSVAETVRALAGSRSPIVTGAALPVSAILHRRPDLARLRGLLGRAPSSPIDDALARAVAAARVPGRALAVA
ncbi:MAG TPA: NAD-dependent epimerase/dehydratase family protein [Planctomycetota bacterium]|nr:NAD-dependent epimerase/dehydratase family protein [Planctomycetota bacterium]